ncbi:MAG TPA: HD-GYP domain-containing protein [Actinomycetes bacterium]
MSRPVLAAALRVAIVLVPAVVSLAAVAAAAWLVRPPSADAAAVARLGGLLLLGVVVAIVVERAARRLLPLVVLLKMAMLFPDRAPSRLRAARRACSVTAASALRPQPGDDARAVADRVVALLAALASHDRRTRGHAHRVHVLAELLARELGLARADRDKLRWAALLHDIGKLEVPSSVLNKPASLDDDEWAAMRAHPEAGARLAGPLLGWLGPWGDAIAQHHERFDGTGYPLGLAGDGIGYAGRLVCLVDAFETMTAARAYKKAMATRDARAELARCAGTQFDPQLVRAFLAIPLPRLLWAGGPFAFLVQVPFLPLIQAGGRTAAAGLTAASTGLVAGGAAVVIGSSLGMAATATAAPASATSAPVVVAADGSTSTGTSSGGGATGSPLPAGGTGAGTSGGGVVTHPTAVPSASAVPTGSAAPSSTSSTPKPITSTVAGAVGAVGGVVGGAVGGVASALPTVALPVATIAPSTGPSGTSVTVTVPILPPIKLKLP